MRWLRLRRREGQPGLTAKKKDYAFKNNHIANVIPGLLIAKKKKKKFSAPSYNRSFPIGIHALNIIIAQRGYTARSRKEMSCPTRRNQIFRHDSLDGATCVCCAGQQRG